MNRTLCLTVLTFAACDPGMPAPDAVDAATATDLLAALEQETGHGWTARWRSDGTPALLEGATAPLASTPKDAERAGRAFIRNHRALFSMGPHDDVAATDSDIDELGMTHARFGEEVQGYDVWGGELWLHFAKDGSLVRINGRYLPISSDLGQPAIGKDQARVAAVAAAQALDPKVAPDGFTTRVPKLFAYPTARQTAKLTWMVQVDVSDAATPSTIQAFVDASDGSLVHAADVTAYLTGSGVGVDGRTRMLSINQHGQSYWLEDVTRGRPATRTFSAKWGSRRPGSAVRSKDPMRWDESAPGAGAAVDAHAFVAASWDYFASTHGRAGFDDSGKGVHATVHFGDHFGGAFFDGTQLVFGDGDGQVVRALSGGRDIVAHEFTHGVIAHSARLTLEGQSGALAEGIADIFACFIDGDWLMGETIYRPGGIPHPLRNLSDPRATGNPSTVAGWVQTSDDNGGIHVNSTIVSHVAYLMAQADAPAAEKIWYRALVRYLYSSADLADAADATLAAARDLGLDVAPVRAGWVAAGVVQ